MGAYAARANAKAGSELLFELYRVPRDGQSTEAKLTKLKLVIGPGDDGEPVRTILVWSKNSCGLSMIVLQ